MHKIYNEIDDDQINEIVELIKNNIGQPVLYRFNDKYKFEILPLNAMVSVLNETYNFIFAYDSLDILDMSKSDLADSIYNKIYNNNSY